MTQPAKRRGRPSKKATAQNITYTPSLIDFSAITKLNNLNVDPKMMETMKSGLALDHFVSYEGGVPCASNMMVIGDPGVGKTTLLLDLLAAVQNKSRKHLLTAHLT